MFGANLSEVLEVSNPIFHTVLEQHFARRPPIAFLRPPRENVEHWKFFPAVWIKALLPAHIFMLLSLLAIHYPNTCDSTQVFAQPEPVL